MALGNHIHLLRHQGHEIEVATYGDPVVNVAVECLDCCEVLFDMDSPGEER